MYNVNDHSMWMYLKTVSIIISFILPPQWSYSQEKIFKNGGDKNNIDILIGGFEYKLYNNALQYLLNSNELILQNTGKITIQGKDSTKIYQDDESIKLSGGELLKYLSSIRSDELLKIQILYNPPLVFQPGNYGVINIVTKKYIRKPFIRPL